MGIKNRRKFFVGALKGKGAVRVSLKGMALLCAIDAGMIQETRDGGYDDEPFLRFWNEFSRFIPTDRRGYPGELNGVIELIKKEEGE